MQAWWGISVTSQMRVPHIAEHWNTFCSYCNSGSVIYNSQSAFLIPVTEATWIPYGKISWLYRSDGANIIIIIIINAAGGCGNPGDWCLWDGCKERGKYTSFPFFKNKFTNSVYEVTDPCTNRFSSSITNSELILSIFLCSKTKCPSSFPFGPRTIYSPRR